MLRPGKNGKCPNNASKSAFAKHRRAENLTKDSIPTIMDAILNAIKTCANPEPGSECQTTHCSGHQVTCRNANTHTIHLHSNTACAVPCETKCEHSIPLVLLDQSFIEIIPLPELLPLTVTLTTK